jgi:pSer/pThr/pTyr-binding forkhead associated (FHA) protein
MPQETETNPDATSQELESNKAIPINAFLIVGGTQVFHLDADTINIGRKLDNHLVIDDPRVSRYHARMRSLSGRFMLYDLGSSGGTFVNELKCRSTQVMSFPLRAYQSFTDRMQEGKL